VFHLFSILFSRLSD